MASRQDFAFGGPTNSARGWNVLEHSYMPSKRTCRLCIETLKNCIEMGGKRLHQSLKIGHLYLRLHAQFWIRGFCVFISFTQ